MKRGRIIVIEGTDCSGKQTQSSLLYQRLQKEGRKVETMSFPVYDSPTGKIIGGPLLGKSYICEGWFPETAVNVPSKVASLYYAADRLYHREKIKSLLEEGYDVILDRYTESNMAHQGAKLKTTEEREKLYEFIESLEYELLELPRPDITIFLYMPFEKEVELRGLRNVSEKLDQAESNEDHLRSAEAAYLELAKRNGYITIPCSINNALRKIEEIHEDVYAAVINHI